MQELDIKRSFYPRVTEIIEKQNSSEFKSIPIETLANACIRGQKVHEYCTAWIKNLWIDDIEEEYRPYVDAFIEWADENIEECLHAGIRLYDDTLCFSGEFDMIVKLKRNSEIALIDIKTSATKSKTWPLQLAAYSHLCKLNGYDFGSIYNIHLAKVNPAMYEEKEGKKVLVSSPKVKVKELPYGDISSYWEIFSSALKCYDYFDRKEVK